MLKNSIINLVNKSSAINNKDHEYHIKKCIAAYLVENTYKINLDNMAPWQTITLQNTFVHLNSHGNCSGLLIGPDPMPIPLPGTVVTQPPDRFLSAAHCLHAIGKPGLGPDFTTFKKLISANIPIIARRFLGNWVGNDSHDVGIYTYNKPDQAFIDSVKNVYVLENPEDIRRYQKLYKKGHMTGLRELMYNNGCESSCIGFLNYLSVSFDDTFMNIINGPPTITQAEIYGFMIHRDQDAFPNEKNNFIIEMKKQFFQITKIDGTLLVDGTDIRQGDSGGPIFIPFGDNKLALVGVISTQINGLTGIIAAVAPHIRELENTYGLKIKRARIDYEHDDLNDDVRCPGTIIICPENTGTQANPDDLYSEFNRIK